MNKLHKDHNYKFQHMTEISPITTSSHYDSIELTNSLIKKRLKIDKNSMIDAIIQLEHNSPNKGVIDELEKYNLLCKSPEESLDNNEHINHWNDRNWELSLNYYCWTRDISFVDNGKEYNRKREEVLQEFLNEEDIPKKKEINILKKIHLPKFEAEQDKTYSLGEVLLRRTNVQTFKDIEMKKNTFNRIIYNAFSNMKKEANNVDYDKDILNLLRGLGYPFNVYLLIFNVEGLEPGIYHYNIQDHSLGLIDKGDFRKDLQKVLIGQSAPLTSSFALLLTVDYRQKQWRYRHERELRNTYLASAQITQQFILSATENDAFCNLTPASQDRYASQLLKLDDKYEQLLYTVNVGLSH
ncbi:hypothetical protein CAI16_19315 [Virgibacillus dokdonensis]|uniref:Nitroreductase domain-containing protein n=1 Tax=Virgibacillus dokdonensis TaxID=302167 RepID=A0A3E0WGA7_9BACI|nr:SagB/ThcOx family dehydrogenase [Virgibacillus dokdonensis]RFA31980.1 hypothetical protein CAI16_19315 [Virgibacillus dokdonensis]